MFDTTLYIILVEKNVEFLQSIVGSCESICKEAHRLKYRWTRIDSDRLKVNDEWQCPSFWPRKAQYYLSILATAKFSIFLGSILFLQRNVSDGPKFPLRKHTYPLRPSADCSRVKMLDVSSQAQIVRFQRVTPRAVIHTTACVSDASVTKRPSASQEMSSCSRREVTQRTNHGRNCIYPSNLYLENSTCV